MQMSSLSLSSPTRSGKDYNGLETTDSPTSIGNGFSKGKQSLFIIVFSQLFFLYYNSSNAFVTEGGGEAGDALGKLLDTIENSTGPERKAAFEQLATIIRESDPITLNTHFRLLHFIYC